MARTTNKAEDLLTFTRASTGRALTKVAYGPELVTNGTFDTDSDWTYSSGIITGGVFTDTANNPMLKQSIDILAGKTVQITFDFTQTGGGTGYIYTDSTGGQFTSFSGTGSYSYITQVGSSGTPEIRFYLNFLAGGTFTIDNISVREVLYNNPTGTIKLIEHPTNTPRIEYDANGVAKGLLIEEARTNLEAYSEEFFNRAIWTSSPSGSETANAATAPDESISADYIYGNAAGGGSVYKYRSYTLTASTPYTFSVFAKKADSNWIFIRSGAFDASSNVYVWFDLENGVQGSESPSSGTTLSDVSITPLQNGWYRCSITVTLGTDNTGLFQIGVVSADGNIPYAAGETVGTYLWGAQLEQGSFPTSYIPTDGATGTRSADIASIPVSTFAYRDVEGTVLVDFGEIKSIGATADYFIISTNNSFNPQSYGIFGNGIASTVYYRRISSAYNPSGSSLIPAPTECKMSLSFDSTTLTCAINGTVASTAISGIATGVTEIRPLTTGVTGARHSGYIKSIKYYPVRLDDDKLKELTL